MLQVANLQRTRFTKRLDAPPSLITRGMPLAEGKVEGRFEHAEDAVGTRPSRPHGVGILSQSSRLCRWSAQRSGTA